MKACDKINEAYRLSILDRLLIRYEGSLTRLFPELWMVRIELIDKLEARYHVDRKV